MNFSLVEGTEGPGRKSQMLGNRWRDSGQTGTASRYGTRAGIVPDKSGTKGLATVPGVSKTR